MILLPLDRYSCDIGEDSLPISGGGEICNHLDITVIFIFIIIIFFSHLPGWFKALLPKSALTVEEKAWNAYPYTKTTFR